MVEKVITPLHNVVDFARYQSDRSAASNPFAISMRVCRYCGAALSEGEKEDECSSAFNVDTAGTHSVPRKVYVE